MIQADGSDYLGNAPARFRFSREAYKANAWRNGRDFRERNRDTTPKFRRPPKRRKGSPWSRGNRRAGDTQHARPRNSPPADGRFAPDRPHDHGSSALSELSVVKSPGGRIFDTKPVGSPTEQGRKTSETWETGETGETRPPASTRRGPGDQGTKGRTDEAYHEIHQRHERR